MKSAFFYGYRADVLGLFCLASGLFFTLALASYYPLDPSFNSLGATAPVQNKCGYLGSFLSDLLYQSFGWGAWFFVLGFFKYSLLAFQRRIFIHGGFWRDTFLFGFSVLVVSCIFELHFPEQKFFQGHITSGGLLGHILVQQTQPYLHFTGSFLFLWFLCLMLVMVYTKTSLSTFLTIFLKSIKLFFIYFFSIRPEMLNSFFGKIKYRVGQVGSFLTMKKFRKTNALSEEEEDSEFVSLNEESYAFLEEDSVSEQAQQVNWKIPPLSLLKAPLSSSLIVKEKDVQENAERVVNKLAQFSISGQITEAHTGPAITLFEFKPEDHVKIARITQMEDDLMIALKSESIRIIAPIPGKDVVGIETAHGSRQTVFLKHLVEDPSFWQESEAFPLILGRYVDGRAAVFDLRKIPHLMVAGSTGSGKSVFVSSFLVSLLFRYTPENLRLLLVDPKQVELSVFEGIPHLLTPPVRHSKHVVLALQWCVNEMNKRYRSLAKFQVKKLNDFNETVNALTLEDKESHQEIKDSLSEEENYYFSAQPYICIVLEEFGDLMSSPERMHIENLVVRLAQMARACGIHLVLSMQSPRKDVVTGLIKTNIPGRISFKVSSRIDSRIILDEGGAERLLSQGDMLYLGPGQAHPERFHGPFVKEKEISAVVKFWKKQNPEPDYAFLLDGNSSDDKRPSFRKEYLLDQEDQKYAEVCEYISSELKEVSASYLQRKYSLGYPRAARLIDRLEEEGVVGPARGSKPRKVLIQK